MHETTTSPIPALEESLFHTTEHLLPETASFERDAKRAAMYGHFAAIFAEVGSAGTEIDQQAAQIAFLTTSALYQGTSPSAAVRRAYPSEARPNDASLVRSAAAWLVHESCRIQTEQTKSPLSDDDAARAVKLSDDHVEFDTVVDVTNEVINVSPTELDHTTNDTAVAYGGVPGNARKTTDTNPPAAATVREQKQLTTFNEETLENELLVASMGGDGTAFNELWRRHSSAVLRYCKARLRIDEGAEDVAQEVGLALLHSLQNDGFSIRSDKDFMAFVHGIAWHKVIDRYRARNRDLSDSHADVPDLFDPVEGPEDTALNNISSALQKVLAELPTKYQKQVLYLRIVVGLSADETARQLDSTAGAVRVTQHKALSRLRESETVIQLYTSRS